MLPGGIQYSTKSQVPKSYSFFPKNVFKDDIPFVFAFLSLSTPREACAPAFRLSPALALLPFPASAASARAVAAASSARACAALIAAWAVYADMLAGLWMSASLVG